MMISLAHLVEKLGELTGDAVKVALVVADETVWSDDEPAPGRDFDPRLDRLLRVDAPAARRLAKKISIGDALLRKCVDELAEAGLIERVSRVVFRATVRSMSGRLS